LRQWVVAGSSKIPFNPRTGQVASPTDPDTWGSFEEALSAGAPHIGFVLTKEDPYCIIDLDDKEDNPATEADKARFAQMLDHFQTYTEVSASGRGIHIVLKGSLPSGVHRSHVEIYSDARYIIFTGNVLKNLPIAEGYQETLSAMYGQMKPEDSIELVERDEVVDDVAIYDMAANAANSDKFNALCRGDMADYPSQSEADLALLSILAYYTQSDEQVRRLFRCTALGQREKATKNNTYLNFALRKIRAKQPPPVDLSAIFSNAQHINGTEDLPQVLPPAPAPIATSQLSNVSLPPGLVGEVAQYVYATSIRPVPEIALATAIAFVAGIAGRAYNTSTRAGLSQYIALLAKTGTGKEAAASAISRLLMTVRPKIPAAMEFMGPSVFASGPALHRILSSKPCFVSVLGEFGLLLQKLSNKNANTADLTLKKTLLDSYGKSGYGDMLQPSVYSDKEKDVAAIASPNITILGESTPESFYDALDASAVTSGFLPRFFIIEYFGERPERNTNPGVPPSEGLLNRVAEVITYALTAQANNTCMPVMEDTHGKAVLDAFDKECDGNMRGHGDVLAEVWNRGHLKALKLAALIAVGVNPHQPVVTQGIAEWAVALIRADSTRLAARFRAGDIGEGFQKQRTLVIDAIKWFLGTTHKTPKREAFRSSGVIERSAIHPRVAGQPAFKGDRNPLDAFNKVMDDLIKNGEVVQIDSKTMKDRFGSTATCYGVGDNWNPG
jgi:hypothetical protein